MHHRPEQFVKLLWEFCHWVLRKTSFQNTGYVQEPFIPMPWLLFICSTNRKLSVLTAAFLIHQHVTADSSKTCCRMGIKLPKAAVSRILLHTLSSWDCLELQETCDGASLGAGPGLLMSEGFMDNLAVVRSVFTLSPQKSRQTFSWRDEANSDGLLRDRR